MYIGHEDDKYPATNFSPSVDQEYLIKFIEEDLYNKLYRWTDACSEHNGKYYTIMNARPIPHKNGVVYDIVFIETLTYVTTKPLFRAPEDYVFLKRIKNKAILSF